MAENADIKWYVVHTYSGYENKVKVNLEKAVENNGMQDKIAEVSIPVEDVMEIKNNKRRVVQRKLLPGYVHGQDAHDQRDLVYCAQYPRRDRLCRRGQQAHAPVRRPISPRCSSREPKTQRATFSVGDTVRILTRLV